MMPVVRPAADDPRQVELVADDLKTALLRVRPDDGRVRNVVSAGPLIHDTLITVVRQAPALVRRLPKDAGTGNGYLVTFPAEVQRALADGSARLMHSGARTLPTVVSAQSGRIIAQGTVVSGSTSAVGGAGGSAAGGAAGAAGAGATGTGAAVTGGTAALPVLPVVAVAAVAIGVAYLMKRDLDNSIAAVEDRILAILDRMHDDDYGRLEAALHAARHTEEVLEDGAAIPEHYRLQLAVANRDADAIYLARHRLLRRFQDDHERIYAEVERTGGDRRKVPKALEELISDPGAFQREAAIYIAALVTRARVESAVASLLAVDGHAQLSMRRSEHIARELHHDAHSISRRIRGLSRGQARGDKREKIVEMARALHEMLEAAKRALPPPELVDVTVRVELPADVVEEHAS